MPSIINRAGVVEDFGEETGGGLEGDSAETVETPIEVKSSKTPAAAPASEAKTVKPK